MLSAFVDELSTLAGSLREDQPGLPSLPVYWSLLGNGDADFHDNVIFFGFDGEHADPVLVVKVPRLTENGWMLQKEYERLIELWSCMGDEAARYIPRPYALATLQGKPALLISYVPGESLTRLSRKSFWRNAGQVSGLAREAASSLRHLHHLTECPVGDGASLGSDFQLKAERFRELFPLTAEEDRALSDLTQTLGVSTSTASHRILIQGDFWHGNMIRDEAHGRLMFVDWQFARWSADASMDVYFFLLAGALSATEAGSVQQRAKDAFDLLKSWRAMVIPDYLSTYGKPRNFRLLPQQQGMLMCCIEKATRSALDFGYSHPDDLMWRHLFAELLHWQDAG